MNGQQIEDLTREELMAVVRRDRFVKEQLSSRVGGLIHENLELVGVIQDLQNDLAALRQAQATLNGEVTTPATPAGVTS